MAARPGCNDLLSFSAAGAGYWPAQAQLQPGLLLLGTSCWSKTRCELFIGAVASCAALAAARLFVRGPEFGCCRILRQLGLLEVGSRYADALYLPRRAGDAGSH